MSYISIVLGLLKLANVVFSYFQQQGWIAEGEAIQVAKASAEIMRKSGYAKHALEDMHGESDTGLDDILRSLEPGERDKSGS